MNLSVVICTYNHCESLRQTLAALERVRVPEGVACELIVVDNASTDATAEAVRARARLANMTLRYVHEPRQGLAYARNTAIASARGEIIMFTDDDVRPGPDWVERMSAPILSGGAHAVAGGVKIAPHLEREWMTPLHRAWLSSTELLDAENPQGMVGANMAFSREVLSRVPCYDTELGAGRLGFGEDSLFSFQLKEAGYRIAAAFEAVVEHHFDESRLLRSSFLNRAQKEGRARAYLAHHWEHRAIRRPRQRLMKCFLWLAKWRFKRRGERLRHESMPEWEMHAVSELYFYKQYLIERRRPRNYEKYGLAKLPGGETCAAL